MPYTKDTPERPRSAQIADPQNLGELTLSVTDIAIGALQRIYNITGKIRYSDMCRVIGVFAHLENTWRHAVPGGRCELGKEMSGVISEFYSLHRGDVTEYDILGVLRCASNEFYRRVVATYENKKIHENGDVFPQEVL